MNPRFQKLASDWKTYVALLTAAGAAISALTDLVKQATEGFATLQGLSLQLRWVVAAVLLVVTVVFLVSALSRRSLLLEPKRFLLSPDNPEHLVGREEEVAHLTTQCQRHAIVFLTGDSGSGKSSLVRAGLAHTLRSDQDSSGTGRDLVPIVVDLSGVGWQRGLSLAIARELGKLPEEVWATLGDGSRPSAEDLFAWIRNRPAHSPRQLLLILDQFDDYLAVHRTRFYAGTTLRRSRDLERANADWHGLAELLRDGLLSLLVVARSDAAPSFPVLSFVEEAAIASEHLPRLEPNLVAPLLTRLTEPVDDEHPVISDPQFGWLQLRSRLLRDLEAAGDGQVLPVQLAVALNSLRLSRSLTVAEYERNGGLRGLERLHVERHADKAAEAANVSQGAVLEALRAMVSPDGSKTQPVMRTNFETVLSGRGATDAGRAVFQLENDRVLRRVLGEGEPSETLLLYHDYLARGVREAHRQANLWTELLRERSQAYQEAIGWRQRWRALLSPTEQCKVLWERLRGRFSFNSRRAFVGLSTVRWLPIVLAVLVFVAAGKEFDHYRKEQMAAQILGVIGHTPFLREEEAHQIQRLEAAGRDAAIRALHLAAESPEISTRASLRVDQLIPLAIGLDPDRDSSNALLTELVRPTLENPQAASASAAFAAAVASRLHLTPSAAKQVAKSIVARMKIEADSTALALLGSALGDLNAKLDSQQVWPAAEILVARMNIKTSSYDLAKLGSALGDLNAKLGSQQVRPAAEILVARMKTETDSYALMRLGSALGDLSAKLDSQQVRPAAEILVAQMKIEANNSYALQALSSTLSDLSAKLDSQQIRPAAEILVTRMKIETYSYALVRLGLALGGLSAKLDSQQVRPAAEILITRMKIETDRDALVSLGLALGALSEKLDRQQVRSAGEILITRMNSETDSSDLASLGWVLRTLSEKLDNQQLRPAVELLVARMETETDRHALARLGSAFGPLSAKLESKDLFIPAADALVMGMIRNWQPQALNEFAKDLVILGSSLPQPVHLTNYSYPHPVRIEQVYVDLLKSPFVIDDARTELLKGLERSTGQTFSGDLWKFVDWATQTEAGRAWKLDLEGPRPMVGPSTTENE